MPIKIIGYVEYDSTGLTTAGTYASGPDFLQTMGPAVPPPCSIVANYLGSSGTSQTTTSSSYQTGTTVGTGIGVVVTFTPKSAANLVMVGGGGSYRNASQTLSSGLATIQNVNTTIGGETETLNFGTTNVTYGLILPPFIHGPNTAASTTYSIKFKNTDNTTTQTFPFASSANGVATITAQEIQG